MMKQKNYVSLLQEYVTMKHLPFPTYDISIELEGGFNSVVKIDELVAIGYGFKKKEAKHDSAEKILLKLMERDNGQSSAQRVVYDLIDLGEGTTATNTAIVPVTPRCFDVEKMLENLPIDTVNYVGLLNELCNHNGKTFPNYVESRMENFMFVIECKFFQYNTEGRSSRKKLAKQLAAKEMLNKITPDDLHQIRARAKLSCASSQDIFKSKSCLKNADLKTQHISKRTAEPSVKQKNNIQFATDSLISCLDNKNIFGGGAFMNQLELVPRQPKNKLAPFIFNNYVANNDLVKEESTFVPFWFLP